MDKAKAIDAVPLVIDEPMHKLLIGIHHFTSPTDNLPQIEQVLEATTAARVGVRKWNRNVDQPQQQQQ